MSEFIKTLRTTAAKTVRTANVQISPKAEKFVKTIDEPTAAVKKNLESAGTDRKSPLDSFNLNDKVINNFVDVVNNLIDEGNQQAPYPAAEILSVITPSYRIAPRATIKRSVDSLKVPARELEPYERLTGISQDRPEILLVSEFKPLYSGTSNKQLTKEGEFVDAQIQTRNLKVQNMKKLISALVSSDREFAKAFEKRTGDFKNSVKDLRFFTSFLLRFMTMIDDVKSIFDLRDEKYVINVSDIIKEHNLNFTRTEFSDEFNPLQRSGQKYLPKSFTIVDVLSELGYKRENILTKWSSSRIWMQIIHDYKVNVKVHSFDFFDVNIPAARLNDAHSTTISKLSDTSLFVVNDVDSSNVPSMEQMAGLQEFDVEPILTVVQKTYAQIYAKNAYLKSQELKMAALANVLSKEFSYSSGLADQEFGGFLQQKFGYQVESNNLRVFDAVFGRFPSSVLEIPTDQFGSLASFAQKNVAQNVGVLTFESKYVKSNLGTTTPGTAWFIDSVITDSGELDPNRVVDLANEAKNLYVNFNTFVNRMNLYSVAGFDSTDQRFAGSLSSMIPDVLGFSEYVAQFFLDENGDTRKHVLNDVGAAVYSHGTVNGELRALLFMLSVARITRSYKFDGDANDVTRDNTIYTEKIVKRIERLLSAIKLTSGTRNVANELVSSSTLINSIRVGGFTSIMIESFMIRMLNEFRKFAVNRETDSTWYSGYLDTVIMMMTFDMLISAINRFSNQSLLGRAVTLKQNNNFVIVRKSVNFKKNLNELKNKLGKEVAGLQKMTWTVLTILKRFSDILTNFSNALKTKEVKDSFSTIRKRIGTNELNLLLNKQQVMLFASTVEDLATTVASTNTTFDPNVDTDVTVIDNIEIPTMVKRTFLETFKQPELVGFGSLNKKILSVGLSLGFVERFKQESRITTKSMNFVEKQNDIFSLNVYKIDVLNEDLIFRPQRFLFEASRFPVRDFSGYRTIKAGSDFDSIIQNVPTRDFEQDSESFVSYYKNSVKGLAMAMNAQSYAFLTEKQKTEIIRNHVMSFMLELYVQLMTGIKVSEGTFDIDKGDSENFIEPEFTKLIITKTAERAKKNVAVKSASRPLPNVNTGSKSSSASYFGSMFSSVPNRVAPKPVSQPDFDEFAKIVAGVKPDTLTAMLGELINDRKTQESFTASLKIASELLRTRTTISVPTTVAKQLLRPKQFDRVLNVIVDPDDFEIDERMTMETSFGQQALQSLLKRGDIVVSSQRNGRTFRFRERNTTTGEVTFDRYFITVSSIDEVV